MAEIDVPVALLGSEHDPLGIVRCSGDCSLVEARQMIDDEVDDIPDDFIFVLAGAIAILDQSEEAGHTVNEFQPATIVIQDRGDVPIAPTTDSTFGDDFGDFGGLAPEPDFAAGGSGFGDFGSFDAPTPGATAVEGDFGDFGAASTTIADDDFGSFTTDSATPAPAAEPDNFFGEFGDDPPPATVPAPAAQSFAGPDDFDSFGDAQAHENDSERKLAEEAAKAAAEAAEASAQQRPQEPDERECLRVQQEQENSMFSRHSATLSSRDQRLAETLQIEKQRVESEVRELKMLKNALESRLEEQRMNLEENEEAMLAMRKKNREEIARTREQGNENLANVLEDFKEWQASVNEQHAKTMAEERQIAQAQLQEVLSEEQNKARQTLVVAYEEQKGDLSIIQAEFKAFQLALGDEHRQGLQAAHSTHATELETIRGQATEQATAALDVAVRSKEEEISTAIETACAAVRAKSAAQLKDKLEEASNATVAELAAAMEAARAESIGAIETALSEERSRSAALLADERAKFYGAIADAVATEKERGVLALQEQAEEQRTQTAALLEEQRQMWSDTLETNRSAMQEMLAAQESKFAEVADGARRRTSTLLEAEVSRNDAARQNALATLGVFLGTAQGQLTTIMQTFDTADHGS